MGQWRVKPKDSADFCKTQNGGLVAAKLLACKPTLRILSGLLNGGYRVRQIVAMYFKTRIRYIVNLYGLLYPSASRRFND